MNKKQNSKKKKGFTLVEILVVIIVISVLSSIAVVQYQKSVLKSQFATLLPIAKALHESEELFAMSRGNYTDKLENLDASAGASGSTANINGSIITLGVNNRHAYVKATKENFDNNLIMFQKGSFYFPGEIHCEAKEDKTLANWLCQKELGGEKLDRSLTEGYTDYVINGDGNGFFPKDWVNVNGTKKKELELSSGDTCTGTENYKCYYLNLSNDSTCYANANSACGGSIFTNSNCIATKDGCTANKFVNSTCSAYEPYRNGGARDACANSEFINSVCDGSAIRACHHSTFENSQCIGNGYDSCLGRFKNNEWQRSTFSDSQCIGNGHNACSLGIFNNSTCEGNSDTACRGANFTGNSICYANVQGACDSFYSSYDDITYETTYEDNACCKGQFCPASAPICPED